MLHDILTSVTRELSDALNNKLEKASLKPSVKLGNLVKLAEIGEQSIVCSLINLQEEKTTISAFPQKGLRSSKALAYKVQVLFTPNYKNYADNLFYLAAILDFFQSKPIFNHQNTPDLSQAVEKMMVELCSYSTEENYHLWSILGLPYQPSVIFEIRLIYSDNNEILELSSMVTNVSKNSLT